MIDFTQKPEFNSRLSEEFLIVLRPLDEQYIYNSEIAEALKKYYGLDNGIDWAHWVYVGRQNIKEDKRLEYRAKMQADGWLLLDEKICEQAIKAKKRIELLGLVTTDWLTTKIQGSYRPIKIEKENGYGYFLIAPRKRNRGYWLGNLVEGGYRDCFCKIR